MNALKQPNNRSVLSVTAVITFFGFLDTHLLIPILALYTSELGASIGTVGLVIGLYSITNTPANILFGRLIDRIGYRLPLVAGLLGSALSMFLYTVSRFPIHLAVVRIIHGITGAPIGPATMSVMADYGSQTRKGRAMGLYGWRCPWPSTERPMAYFSRLYRRWLSRTPPLRSEAWLPAPFMPC